MRQIDGTHGSAQGTFASMAEALARPRLDSKRQLTPEQVAICNVRLMPGQVLVINAFAGTGRRRFSER